MKQLYSLLSCLSMLLTLIPLVSYGQTPNPGQGCGNQVDFYIDGLFQGKTVQGQSGQANLTYCPTADATRSITLFATSSSQAVYSWEIVKGTTVTPVSGAIVQGNSSSLRVYPSSSTVYRVTATACNKATFVDFTITPTLQVSSSAGDAAVCPGTSVMLTASGATSGSIYYLEENNTITQQNQTGVFNVNPKTSTTYKITTNTLTCGGSIATQTIQVATNNITLSPSATSITSGTSVTLSATGGTSGQYTWTQRDPTLTTIPTKNAQVTVTPTKTTVYTVSGNTAVGNCPSTFSVTVTVDNQPLPVELVKFDATWVNNNPKLTWATASEKNSAYFNIERSSDGVTFRIVGSRTGAGTTFSRTEYQFTDESLTEAVGSTLYYRLHQVDATGESTYSPVRTVQLKGRKNAFQAEVFPNPFDEAVMVQFRALSAGTATLTIQDMLGHTLFTKTADVAAGAQKMVVQEAASLAAGVYYLTIRQGGQQQVVKLSHR